MRSESKRRFVTQELEEFFQETRQWYHHEHPFLDPVFHEILMPALDFTNLVATWLQQGRIDPVEELWSVLTADQPGSDATLCAVLANEEPPGIFLSAAAWAELRAIRLLTLRAKLCSGLKDTHSLVTDLSGSVLACRQLEIGPHCEKEVLFAIMGELTPAQIHDFSDKDEAAENCLRLSMEPIEGLSLATELLKPVPAMVRLVFADHLARCWAEDRVDFTLSYEHRLYGCGKPWMESYVRSLECFEPRDGLLGFGRLKPMFAPAMKAWNERLRWCKPVGAALIKLLCD